jgi:Repeat of unknown function (DUF5907)
MLQIKNAQGQLVDLTSLEKQQFTADLGAVRSVNGTLPNASGDVTISVSGGSVANATATTPGLVQLATGQSAVQLSAVASTGSYNDLTNRPTIPAAYTLPAATTVALGGVKVGAGLSVAGDGTLSATGGATIANATATTPGLVQLATGQSAVQLSAVASTGSYNDLTNRPTIPAAASNATTTAVGLVQLAGDLGGTATAPTVPGLASKQATLVSGTNIKTVAGQSLLGSGAVTLAKADVGLANVDNTSDANKPVSTAQAAAIANKQDVLVSGTNIKTINGTSILGAGNITVSGGSAVAPTFATESTTGKTLAAADIGRLVRYNSSANGSFVIPTDAVLGITDATSNVTIEFYQTGTGRLDVIGDTANGVVVNKWTGYPTSSQFVTQTFHRVGVNTWAAK